MSYTIKGGKLVKPDGKTFKAMPNAPANGQGMAVEEVSAKNSDTGQNELYLLLGGERMAYRGHPGTADAGKWVSLHPDRFVIDNCDDGADPDEQMRKRYPGIEIVEGGDVQEFPEPKGRVQ